MTTPVLQALAAAAAYPPPPPVPAVEYRSQGRVLVIADANSPLAALQVLAGAMPVSVLLADTGATATPTGCTWLHGEIERLSGWLGAFSATWHSGNARHDASFDLVLNLTPQPLFTMHQPPQGYFAPVDEAGLRQALDEILDGIGEFEKPKFFLYHADTCAHSRSRLQGCDRCIDICSTSAISPADNGVRVEPHLCMGCGACASVCPSGAMQYNFPAMPYWSGKLKAVLGAHQAAGGKDACLLLHNPGDGAALLRSAELPAHALPLEVFHIASIGLDWLLGALALGVNRVAILAAGSEAPQYINALREQMALGEDILAGLGYGSGHFSLIEAQTPAALQHVLAELPPASVPAQAAGFDWFDDKRTTLDFCLDHFVRHAPATVPDSIALAVGAPYGSIAVDGSACTLCLSCVSTCPANALQDGGGIPMLKFIERNCVQCGLCENACPEHAISLQPRLLLTAEAKQPRVLHQDQPFHCVRCGKPFATTHMVGSILHKLSGHSMFSTPEARRRLQMCGDCRVIDMMATGEAMTGSRP